MAEVGEEPRVGRRAQLGRANFGGRSRTVTKKADQVSREALIFYRQRKAKFGRDAEEAIEIRKELSLDLTFLSIYVEFLKFNIKIVLSVNGSKVRIRQNTKGSLWRR